MQVLFLFMLTGFFPLGFAVRTGRHSPLVFAAAWATLAWATWSLLALEIMPAADLHRLFWLRYLALCLTCSAGMAVLGARKPGAAAWNAVVVGLLAVLLLPLAEGLLIGNQSLVWLRLMFLAGALVLVFLNYLPTCFALAAFIFALAISTESMRLVWPADFDDFPVPEAASLLALALAPWVAFVTWQTRPRPPSEFDRLWRNFRNCFGLVWAARLRDQFNRAAANARWPVHLYWQGLHVRRGESLPSGEVQDQIVETLQALLKRFR